MTPSPRDFAHRFADLGSFLHEPEIATLIATLTPREVPAGDVLLREGEPSHSAYLVWEGELGISIAAGDERTDVGGAGPGVILGEISFIDGGPVTATVIATLPSTVFTLSADALDTLRREHPRVATAVLRAMSRSVAARIRRVDALLDVAHGATALQPPHPIRDALRALFGLS